jgi:hypothetical protein
MEKIPTIYPRDESKRGHPVVEPVKPECAWVELGEGVATRKLDGMNVKVEGSQLYKRKKPKDRDYDRASYVECDRESPGDKYLWEAFDALDDLSRVPDGIYEAIGPKIQGNPEGCSTHQLIRVVPYSETLEIENPPRTFDEFRAYFEAHDIEGIVFHHEDGRLAKIKARDFQVGRGLVRQA